VTNESAPIASARHTVTLAAIFVAIGLLGAYVSHTGAIGRAALTQDQKIQLYSSLVVMEWSLVYGVWSGVRRRGVALTALLGRNSWHAPSLLLDAALSVALWSSWLAIETFLPAGNDIRPLLPRTGVETALWVIVALSAGICEELVFRGYFQRQFSALSGSSVMGVVLQALLFGAGHFYEGRWAVVKVVIYGILFGAVAAWRGSLRPGMVAHSWSDLFVVFVGR